MPKVAKARRRADSAEAAVLYRPHDIQCIGAHADHRREDFVFSRTQSLELREAQWEKRLKPLRAWTPNFVANLAFGIFA